MTTEHRLWLALEQAQKEIDLLRSYCRNEMSERDQQRLAVEMSNRGFTAHQDLRNELFGDPSWPFA